MESRPYIILAYNPHTRATIDFGQAETYTEAMDILAMASDCYPLGKLEHRGRKLAILINRRVYVHGVPSA